MPMVQHQHSDFSAALWVNHWKIDCFNFFLSTVVTKVKLIGQDGLCYEKPGGRSTHTRPHIGLPVEDKTWSDSNYIPILSFQWCLN